MTSVMVTCLHPRSVLREPVARESCVNVEEVCVDCGEVAAVTSYTKDAWIHHQMKRIVTVQQANLFSEREAG